MIGVVVAAHGGFAEAVVKAVRLFVGDAPKLVPVDLAPDAGPDTFVDTLKRTVEQTDDGDGVIILADLYGGTPANSAWKLICDNDKWTAVTGINLTILLEVVMNRDNVSRPQELAEMAVSAGREGIQPLARLEAM